MRKLILLCVVFLAACSFPITAEQWERAEKLCSANNGVEVVSHPDALFVYCRNGAQFRMQE